MIGDYGAATTIHVRSKVHANCTNSQHLNLLKIHNCTVVKLQIRQFVTDCVANVRRRMKFVHNNRDKTNVTHNLTCTCKSFQFNLISSVKTTEAAHNETAVMRLS